jgi:hypothetical protein
MIVFVVDEAVTYGVPFSDQGDVSSSSLFDFFHGEGNSLTISPTLVTGGELVEPEPGSVWSCAIGLTVLLLMASYRPARWTHGDRPKTASVRAPATLPLDKAAGTPASPAHSS